MKDKVVIITVTNFNNQTIKTYNLDHMTNAELMKFRDMLTGMLRRPNNE